MALPTLPGDQRNKSRNPGQDHYDRQFNDIANRETKGTFDDIVNNYDKSADPTKENENIDKLRQNEESINNRYTGKPDKQGQTKQVLKFLVKRKAGIGIIGGLIFGGGLLAGILGPSSMLVNMVENLTDTNDSSSTALERRILKALGFATKDTDPICANNTKLTLRCKMGRVSNSALNQLKRKGVIAYFGSDDIYDGKKSGYPKKNPTGYKFVDSSGKELANVKAADLMGFLNDPKNRKLASQVLGVRGAFNMRMKAWTGKYITNKFLSKVGITKDKGAAKNDKKGKSLSERMEAMRKQVTSKLPGYKKLSEVSANIEKKVNSKIGAAKKGGFAYTAAVGGCLAVKLPAFITGGVAAVQLLNVLPFVSEFILQPGSAIKASGVDSKNAITQEEIEPVLTSLTERTKDKDGKLSSALDSELLQQQLGVNKSKAAVSTNFAPGYQVMKNLAVLNQADKNLEPACNTIMSPASMWTAFAVDSAVTVAASATIIGGLIKVGISFIISEVVSLAVTSLAGGVAQTVIEQVAKNDLIPQAKGKEFGDLLAVSSAAFFSSGGSAHNLPVLKTSQLSGWGQVTAENQKFNQEMDIASLSPFDVSSKYTFLGSIVRSIQNVALANPSITGFISGLSSLPFKGSANVSAISQTIQNCGYASSFNQTTEDPAEDPGVTAAGTPCTGLTIEQVGMSTETAISLLEEEGWLDNTSNSKISSADTIEDLLTKGVIKPDNPLYDYVTTCGDLLSGDYILSNASCTIPGGKQMNPDDIAARDAQNASIKEAQEKLDADSEDPYDAGTDGDPTKNEKAYQAMAVFLLDYQAIASINGEDDVAPGSGGSTGTADLNIDESALFQPSNTINCAPGTEDAGIEDAYRSGSPYKVRLCSLPNTYETDRGGPGLVNSRASAVAFAMFEALKKHLGTKVVTLNDSFRTMRQQQDAKNQYGDQAAEPGYSNHQSGYAFDINMGGANNGDDYGYTMDVNTSYPGNKVWDWLSANAASYHYHQYPREGWHWSINGE